MAQSKVTSRLVTLAFVTAFATGLIYLAFAGQPSLFS